MTNLVDVYESDLNNIQNKMSNQLDKINAYYSNRIDVPNKSDLDDLKNGVEQIQREIVQLQNDIMNNINDMKDRNGNTTTQINKNNKAIGNLLNKINMSQIDEQTSKEMQTDLSHYKKTRRIYNIEILFGLLGIIVFSKFSSV
tara:strand:+ start:1869 stop:2297 length:429 start_codon:yes stop_codon:yes gene_type:complete